MTSGSCVACDGMTDPDAACAGVDPAMPVCFDGTCVACAEGQEEACGDLTPICDVWIFRPNLGKDSGRTWARIPAHFRSSFRALMPTRPGSIVVLPILEIAEMLVVGVKRERPLDFLYLSCRSKSFWMILIRS